MPDNSEIVAKFCQAWSRMDAKEIASYFTDDAVYHNIPMAPYNGKATIQKALEGMATRMTGVRFEIKHQVAQGSVVINERVDHMTIQGRKVSLPVVGVFEMQGGKIKAWRDYFDRGMTSGQSS